MTATPADLLATLDASGVDSVIVSPAIIYPDNGYVLGAAATVPNRILAVVTVDPREPAAVQSIPALAAHGAVGVRVNTRATPLTTDRDFAGLDTLVDVAAAAGLVIQWTIPLPQTGMVERAAARAPAVLHVIDHLGLPPDARDLRELDRIHAMAAIPTTDVKLSGLYALSRTGYPYRDTWRWAEAVVRAFGADRTMWASDWPLAGESATHAEHLALVAKLPFLDDAARHAILRHTAVRVWSRRAESGPE